ncbi:MAG: hypothetical protein Q9170_005708 [Blastenia crenularia]
MAVATRLDNALYYIANVFSMWSFLFRVSPSFDCVFYTGLHAFYWGNSNILSPFASQVFIHLLHTDENHQFVKGLIGVVRKSKFTAYRFDSTDREIETTMSSIRNIRSCATKDSYRPSYTLTSSFDCYPDSENQRFSSDSSSRSSNTSYVSRSNSYRSCDRYAPYGYPAATSSYNSCSSRSQDKLYPGSVESQLDYYTRTAPSKYKRRIARHSGIVHSSHILEQTCAATRPSQKTCTHVSTVAGDIVNYIPTGSSEDVRGDRAVPSKLSMHYMVLLPSYYKPVELQKRSTYHAALVITKNPIGPSVLLAPQPNHERLKATNVPILQTCAYDAYSSRRSFIDDDKEDKKWEWKANTSLGYQIKIVHQDNLHAVIYPGHPNYGLRLADGAFQQVLKELGEEDDELENARFRDVEFWGKAERGRKYSKSSGPA